MSALQRPLRRHHLEPIHQRKSIHRVNVMLPTTPWLLGLAHALETTILHPVAMSYQLYVSLFFGPQQEFHVTLIKRVFSACTISILCVVQSTCPS